MTRLSRSDWRPAVALAISASMWSIAAAPSAGAKDRTDAAETASITAGPSPRSEDSRIRQPVSPATVTTSIVPLDMRLLPPASFEDWDAAPVLRSR